MYMCKCILINYLFGFKKKPAALFVGLRAMHLVSELVSFSTGNLFVWYFSVFFSCCAHLREAAWGLDGLDVFGFFVCS